MMIDRGDAASNVASPCVRARGVDDDEDEDEDEGEDVGSTHRSSRRTGRGGVTMRV